MVDPWVPVIALGVAIGVAVLVLVIIIYLAVRHQKKQKKKKEDERKKEQKKEQNGFSNRTGIPPYRLGEDVFPPHYPPFIPTPDFGEYGDENPIEPEYPEIYPVAPEEYPPPRSGDFFPLAESPFPLRPRLIPPPEVDHSEPPCERVTVFIPKEPPPLPPPSPPPPPPPPREEPIVIYQPMPPPKEIVREIYLPNERRASWSAGPSNDDWVLVKKVNKKTRKAKERKADDSESSDEEQKTPRNAKRLMPYDLALPPRFIQIPQQPIPIPAPVPIPVPAPAPAPVPAPAPAIYFIQQPAPAPPPAPAPAPVPIPVSVPVPAPGNSFFAANTRHFDSGQYEEQEQRATVAGD